MKFARTIRFDPSDLNVFPVAAEEGEWALVGTFCFSSMSSKQLSGKMKQAFSNGFLGCESFGFSTLVSVVSATSSDLKKIENQLANYFVKRFGAPSREAALGAASEEIDFMLELCEAHSNGTLLAIHRAWEDDNIKETFRSLPKPDSCASQQIWTIIEEDTD